MSEKILEIFLIHFLPVFTSHAFETNHILEQQHMMFLRHFQLATVALAMLLLNASAFLIPRLSNLRLPHPSTSPRLPATTTVLNADVTFAIDKLPGMSKNIIICLAFGGGLIPATIAANKVRCRLSRHVRL